jgi:hypothetical protein
MQGMVVELDKEVWLLLTDQLVTAPHSLREGAIVSELNFLPFFISKIIQLVQLKFDHFNL